MKKIILLIMLIVFSISVNAVTVTRLDFGSLDPGDSLTKQLYVGASKTDNSYTLSTEGDIADWLILETNSISLEVGHTAMIDVTLNIPKDAAAGNYLGFVMLEWTEPIGDEETEYMLEVSSKATVEVIGKPSLISPQRLSIKDANSLVSEIESGGTTTFAVSINNNGDSDTTTQVTIDIYDRSRRIVKKITSDTITISAFGKQDVLLDWNTFGQGIGQYKAAISITDEDKKIEFPPISLSVTDSDTHEIKEGNWFLRIFILLVITGIFVLFVKIKPPELKRKILSKIPYSNRDKIFGPNDRIFK